MIKLEDLFSRKLLMVSGKGGTGKSLISAALGMKAASFGKKVLLVESAIREQLSPLFAREQVGHQEVPVAEGIWSINLNPKLCFKEYVVDHLGMVQLYKRVFDHKVVKSFLDAIPGLGETMLLGRLFHTCELKQPLPYDLVIFDAPAMGHFLNLLTTPDAIIDSGMMGPMVKEVERVRGFLADPKKSGALLVTVPEELIISETLEFIPRLQVEAPIAILGIVINRYYDEKHLQKDTLLTLEDRCPTLAPATAYVIAKARERFANQKVLLDGMDAMGVGNSFGVVPDEGRVREPLTMEFVDNLFASLAG